MSDEASDQGNNESAAGGSAAPTVASGERWWWGTSALCGLQTDLDGGRGRDGVRVPHVPIASDAAAGANESTTEGASASVSFPAFVAARARPWNRSHENPGPLRSLQGHPQCATRLGQVRLSSVWR